MESGEEPPAMRRQGSDPVLAGTLKRQVLCSEHPRPLDLVPARGLLISGTGGIGSQNYYRSMSCHLFSDSKEEQSEKSGIESTIAAAARS